MNIEVKILSCKNHLTVKGIATVCNTSINKVLQVLEIDNETSIEKIIAIEFHLEWLHYIQHRQPILIQELINKWNNKLTEFNDKINANCNGEELQTKSIIA